MDIYKFGVEEKYGNIVGTINFEISEIASELLTETAIICARVVVILNLYKIRQMKSPKRKKVWCLYIDFLIYLKL